MSLQMYDNFLIMTIFSPKKQVIKAQKTHFSPRKTDSLCLDRRTKEHKTSFCTYVLMSKTCDTDALRLDRRTKEHKISFCTYVLMSKTCNGDFLPRKTGGAEMQSLIVKTI